IASRGTSMELVATVVLGVVAIAALAVGLMAVRKSRGEMTQLADVAHRLAEAQSVLTGRLSQMAESQQAGQRQGDESLRAQERALSKTLEERLADVTRRVGENLQRAREKNAESMTQLQERLAVIDAAQKNLTDLSAEVVSLQDILSNKQARGAIGQTQME